MALHSAIPEELESLGNTLRAQIEAVNSVISTVTNSLAVTTWTGPARDKFQQDWDGSFKTALSQLNTAFDTAGSACFTTAANTRAALGVG